MRGQNMRGQNQKPFQLHDGSDIGVFIHACVEGIYFTIRLDSDGSKTIQKKVEICFNFFKTYDSRYDLGKRKFIFKMEKTCIITVFTSS